MYKRCSHPLNFGIVKNYSNVAHNNLTQQIKTSYFERVKLSLTILSKKNMSKKRANYSSAFKSKLVLELLQNESILAEIAVEPSKAVKEYKEDLIKSQNKMSD